MTRRKLGIAAATGVFLLLAWIWPDGPGPEAQHLTGSETTASSSPSATPDAGDEAGDTGSPSPEPTEAPDSATPESPAAPEPDPTEGELADDTHRGPLGTRDHTGTGAVALTFDDGPDPDWTPRVLDSLRDRGVKAVFCVIGAYAEAHPDVIADIVHEGHTLCNHTWYHQVELGTWGEAEIRANLQHTNDAIEKAAPGAEVKYFRHPAGAWTERAVGVAADMGMESLHWAVDPADWNDDSTESQIREKVLGRTEPGSVVLMHDGGSNQARTVAALDAVLDEFEHRGYTYTGM